MRFKSTELGDSLHPKDNVIKHVILSLTRDTPINLVHLLGAWRLKTEFLYANTIV